MIRVDDFRGKIALSVGHMAGMIDLAALPLWVGAALIGTYHLSPLQAGLTVTLFLLSVVVVSGILAPKYPRLKHRFVAAGGFAVAAVTFLVASQLPVSSGSFKALLFLHVVAGLGAGSALSVTHGTIGRTSNPHRLFGVVSVAMAVLAILMYATLPRIMAQVGGQALFVAFAGTMAFAAITSLSFFPEVGAAEEAAGDHAKRAGEPMPRVAWLLVGVVICLTLSQSMVFSFVERIGDARDFGRQRVEGALVVMGFINLLPGILAAFLQKRLSAIAVGITGAILQAMFALAITSAVVFALYVVPLVLYVTLVIFTHTFLFGLLSAVDPSGRAVAATPAMMMTGSAIGPVLGGTIVAAIGYHGLGWAVVIISVIAVGLMVLVQQERSRHQEALWAVN